MKIAKERETFKLCRHSFHKTAGRVSYIDKREDQTSKGNHQADKAAVDAVPASSQTFGEEDPRYPD